MAIFQAISKIFSTQLLKKKSIVTISMHTAMAHCYGTVTKQALYKWGLFDKAKPNLQL